MFKRLRRKSQKVSEAGPPFPIGTDHEVVRLAHLIEKEFYLGNDYFPNIGLWFVVMEISDEELSEKPIRLHSAQEIKKMISALKALTVDQGWWPYVPDHSDDVGYGILEVEEYFKVPIELWREMVATHEG